MNQQYGFAFRRELRELLDKYLGHISSREMTQIITRAIMDKLLTRKEQ